MCTCSELSRGGLARIYIVDLEMSNFGELYILLMKLIREFHSVTFQDKLIGWTWKHTIFTVRYIFRKFVQTSYIKMSSA